MSWRETFKRLVPATWRRRLRGAFGWQWFRGDYTSWAEACAAAGGYDAPAIAERVLRATLDVAEGRAAFERDGVTFATPQPDAPLLAALQEIAAARGGLRVLDFGGALGSTYWRHREWLDGIAGLRWDVVEQPSFVVAGREHFAGGPLRFFRTVDEAEAAEAHDVLLCATTLQYLPDPAATVANWIDRGWPWLLFNNLPLHRGAPDRLRVQHVPPEIYPASYPVWFFNRETFLARFTGRYELVREFASEAVWPVGWRSYRSTGLLFRRKESA